jgi:hypothetical protein
MLMRSTRHSRVCWTVAALALAAGGCAAQGTPPTAAPTTAVSPTSSPTATETSPTRAPELVGSWTEPFTIELPNGFIVRDCEGERTHLCVHDGASLLGDVELLTGYPLDATEASENPRDVLQQWAEAFVEQFRDDRGRGCAAFAFEAEAISETTVGGLLAVRAGFTLRDDDGRVVERVINHFTLLDGEVAIVNTDAYVDEGGCLGPSEYDPSFTPEQLDGFEPYLDALVGATPLPST